MEIATKCCDIGGPTQRIIAAGRASGRRSNGIQGDATHEQDKKWMGIEVIHCNISRNMNTVPVLHRTQSKMAMA